MKNASYLCALLILLTQAAYSQQKGYYRTPALFENTVVFTAEGDLWKYDITTGQSSRLTTHLGVESNPVFSPDGKQIVFTGQYEGISELYVMDVNGSVPKRITYDFYGRVNAVQWLADGQIVYSTARFNTLPDPQLVKLNPATLTTELIPLSQASDGFYDADKTLYFTRLPKQGSNNKRYRGGYIQQLWKFDGAGEARCLTCDFEGTSYRPMLYQDRIYFISDRDGSMNIWSMDKEGKSLTQHTTSKEWDIKSANIHRSRMVYQKGADLWLYDIGTKTEKLLDIRLISDFDQRKPRWYKHPGESITHLGLSPEGNFVAVVSRGRLFVTPAKGGRWVEINRKSGIRYKDVAFLDEKTLIYQCDMSGEFEIWKSNADGSGTPQQLTRNSKMLIWWLQPSPDGKWIVYNDKEEVMRIIDAATGALKFELKDPEFGFGDHAWSPDSRYLAYSHSIENTVSQISVVEVATGKISELTTPRLESFTPTWTKDNKWFYFLSERNLRTQVASPWGARQPEPYYSETRGIYALPLTADLAFPFVQKDPWSAEMEAEPEAEPKSKDGKKKIPAPAAPTVNWQYATQHLFQAPVKFGNIGSLQASEDHLYWMDFGDKTWGKGKLFALKMDYSARTEPVEVANDIDGFEISGNRKKILISGEKGLHVGEANGGKVDMEKSKVELSNWNFLIDPVEDWKQMLTDAWRMERDYFYDHNMHGVDWPAVKKQHEALLDRVTDRYELDDLLAQMVSELSALHTFVYGGEKRTSADQIQTGFLGAQLTTDAKGVKISHIYQNDPDYLDKLSPLKRSDLVIEEGDIITAIDDVPVKNALHISELLANKVGVPVKLGLVNKAQTAYQQTVKPISADAEADLRYSEWELSRRQLTDKLGNNEIGYIHLRAMGGRDMDDFVKQFYPVFDRKALILDVRHNRGGNIDSWVLEKLMRKAWFYWKGRTGKSTWNMQYAFRGHMVVICDQFTASDGEAFAEGFRRLGLGKVVGMRTWGGEIWLSSGNVLVDRGIATAAETGVYDPEGKWLIEGHGVDPDFVVDNLPAETFKGKDRQLEFAIQHLQEKIAKEPTPVPPVPAYPDKSFKYKQN